MKVITWQPIKGNTGTEPLIENEDARDLGMILVTNSKATEGNKDRFQGTGKQ